QRCPAQPAHHHPGEFHGEPFHRLGSGGKPAPRWASGGSGGVQTAVTLWGWMGPFGRTTLLTARAGSPAPVLWKFPASGQPAVGALSQTTRKGLPSTLLGVLFRFWW